MERMQRERGENVFSLLNHLFYWNVSINNFYFEMLGMLCESYVLYVRLVLLMKLLGFFVFFLFTFFVNAYVYLLKFKNEWIFHVFLCLFVSGFSGILGMRVEQYLMSMRKYTSLSIRVVYWGLLTVSWVNFSWCLGLFSWKVYGDYLSLLLLLFLLV